MPSRAEANNDLLGLVSHELRTPLHTIQGAADLPRNMRGVPNDLTDAIATGVRTPDSRIGKLLDVAQAGTSHCHLATKMFDLNSALMTALAKHSAAAAENGVNMLSIVGNVLSQATGNVGHLSRVLGVLLTDAVDFITTGKIILYVWIENVGRDEPELHSADDAFLCFTVIDTGIGILQDHAAIIFQPLSLVDKSSIRLHGGIGLGLTLALRLVNLAGGQSSVVSTLGQGSEFRCKWPVKAQVESQWPDARRSSRPIVVAVTTELNVEQSLVNTASTYGWSNLTGVRTIARADELLSDHSGNRPLVSFVDERVVDREPRQTEVLMYKLAKVRTAAVFNCGLAGTRSYAIAVSYAGSSINDYNDYNDYNFDGAVSLPLYRTHVKLVVTDLLSRHRWPTPISQPPTQEPTIATASHSEPANASAAAGTSPRGGLLIAGDDSLNAKLLTRQLQSLGLAVDVAEDGLKILDLLGAEAFSRASTHHLPSPLLQTSTLYAGILMDLDMPHMDGLEATRRLRAMGGPVGHLPVLAVSANGSPSIRDTVAPAGLDDFLSKPVSIQKLKDLLARNNLYESSNSSSP